MFSKELFTGIILAGGKSSRLGTDKGLLIYKGITLAERALQVLRPLTGTILISTNNPGYPLSGAIPVPDLVRGKGPMMGLYSSLLASQTAFNLVMAVDNIYVDTAYFDYVIKRINDYPAALPFLDEMYFEPLVGYYHKSMIEKMAEFIDNENYKLPDLLHSIPIQKLRVREDFPDWHPLYFKSINFPEDLALLSNSI
ncbi:MAG: molybdenum cofactor guanylyltransferase [Bacteroidetes bacterium]|nr:molybdenum cofactor guanylyltransferase [Bacteroidota bacterium]